MRNTAPRFFWNYNGVRNETREIFAVVDFTEIGIRLVEYITSCKSLGSRLKDNDLDTVTNRFVEAGNFYAKNIVSRGNSVKPYPIRF